MTGFLLALGVGIAFGFALHKAGLTHYAVIADVYRFADLAVLEFMLTALLVAAPMIRALVDLGFADSPPLPETRLLANALGGVVFGVGMALAGYCPGTILAEVGEGRLDALVGGLSGLFAGSLVFGLAYPFVVPRLGPVGSLGHVSLVSLSGASPWLVTLVFVEVLALVLLAMRRGRTGAGSTDA